MLGEGELIGAAAAGAGDTTFRRCLVDAAYAVSVPRVGDDTLIRVRYPVDFKLAQDRSSFVVLGDADSAEPLDPSILPRSPPDPVRTDKANDPLGGLRLADVASDTENAGIRALLDGTGRRDDPVVALAVGLNQAAPMPR